MTENKKKLIGITLPFVMSVLMMSGCYYSSGMDSSNVTNAILSSDESYEKTNSSDVIVSDSQNLYSGNGPMTVYLAVAKGNSADNTQYSWAEVNTLIDGQQDSKPSCEAVLQFGDETAPLEGTFGYGDLTANSTVKLYGSGAAKRQQKSYKIEIKKDKGSFEGMKTIILSKNFTDPIRSMDTICFDLISTIPDMFSVRTYQVHLYVKNVSESADSLYVDYGYYTLQEPINKKYFANRNLGTDCAIYKAEDFDWGRHEDVITMSTSAAFNKDEFEKILEIKGDNDHTKLINVLDAVNNQSIPITQVISEYFDEANLYSYMAFKILTGQIDAATENYYIYSPTGSEKFYFITSDNDSAFSRAYEYQMNPLYEEGWNRNIFSFSKSVLFHRILTDKQCMNTLTEYIDLLFNNYLQPVQISSVVEKVTAYEREITYSLPDRTFARVTESNYDKLLVAINDQVSENYYSYYDGLETPLPFHINEPKAEDGKLVLSWDEADCNETVKYNIAVNNSWDMTNPIAQKTGLFDTEFAIDMPAPGQYFVSVVAQSQSGFTQSAYEFYNTEKKTTVHSVLCFYVKGDGRVIASYFDKES